MNKLSMLFTVASIFSSVSAQAQDTAVPIEITYNISGGNLILEPVSGGGNRNRALAAANKHPMLLYTNDSPRVNCPQFKDGIVPLVADGWRRTASISALENAGINIKTLQQARCVILLPR